MKYRDILYGEVTLPSWLDPFVRLPEFLRLRGVRLSNVDSIEYKDLGTATRYDHAIGVVHLALQVASRRKLSTSDTAHLVLAALLHDVGTAPFGHTLELIFNDFDHELEAWNALGIDTRGVDGGFNAVGGELPQFCRRAALLSTTLGVEIRPKTVGEIISGDGELGFLMKGTIDLDNADNVVRGAHYMGLSSSSGQLAEEVADWLSSLRTAPSLDGDLPEVARQWLTLRDEYYRLFYDCSEEERSRQALLQFLIREAHRLGLPRIRILKTTDVGLLSILEQQARDAGDEGALLTDALAKYHRLDSLPKIGDLFIEDVAMLRAFRMKQSISWLEANLRRPSFVPVLFYARRRFSEEVKQPGSLFEYPAARLSIFALYEPRRKPIWDSVGEPGPELSSIRNLLAEYSDKKPWLDLTPERRIEVRDSLSSWGNWAFIGSRNESLHSYPSTFVHAIPSAFIKSLGLTGGLIVDPFCGSGITGIEAAKAGCVAVCADVNEIALLTSRVRFAFLSENQRTFLQSIRKSQLFDSVPVKPPSMPLLDKWHHKETVTQLCTILGFIQSIDDANVVQFLTLCFSSILTSTTARRGREHQYFADNTPLAKDEVGPPYVDAYDLFLARIKRNLLLLIKTYSELSRGSESPSDALERISVIRSSATNSTCKSYGLEPSSVDGIVTSPPYLAMSDYTLGQRLSYGWLWPNTFESDFGDEFGARRRRFNGPKAIGDYFDGIQKFALVSHELLRSGGFVAMVVGAPNARKFEDTNVLDRVRAVFCDQGFEFVWQGDRPISWHRNHGLAKLNKERLFVFAKE